MSPLSAITTLDWFTAVFPLVLSLLLLAVIPYLIIDQRYTLTADDQGLTLKRRLRRHAIRWEEILLFIDSGKNRGEQITETYLLQGQERSLAFEIIRLPELSSPSQKKRRTSSGNKLDSYRYIGGFEQYSADAQRLLATIAARSHVPLQAYTRLPAFVEKIQQRFPDRLTLDELLAAPLAGKEMQPQGLESAAETGSSIIVLKERIALGRTLLETLVWLVIVGALFFACGGLLIFQSIPNSLKGWEPLIWAVLAVFVIPMACLFALQRQENRRPAVIADDAGLTRKTGEKKTTITIPWDEIRAWAIARPHTAAAHLHCLLGALHAHLD